MERLTFEGDFCDIAQCPSTPGGSFCEDGACSQREIWERLKAYEDTGLEPAVCADYKTFEDEAVSKGVTFKRIVALMEADRAGRLVVLPCKVGNTVYWLHNGIITECRAYRAQANRNGTYICLRSNVSHGAFRVDLTWGETVFLTREEAEKALEAKLDG